MKIGRGLSLSIGDLLSTVEESNKHYLGGVDVKTIPVSLYAVLQQTHILLSNKILSFPTIDQSIFGQNHIFGETFFALLEDNGRILLEDGSILTIEDFIRETFLTASPLTGLTSLGVSTDDTQYYLSFDGSSSSVDCGSDSSLDDLPDSNPITVEAWVRFNQLTTYQTVVGKRENSLVGWALYVDHPSDRILAKIYGTGNDAVTVSSDSSLSVDTWYHIAFTYDPATYTEPRVWIDGTEDTNVLTSLTNSYDSDAAKNLIIGARTTDNSEGLYGDIAWVRISDIVRYTTGFTPDEKDSPPAIDGNTVEQWNLNDGSGATANAEVNANNDGTITLGSGSWNAFAEFLLKDEFTTPESAPITSPRTCEPGPGTLTPPTPTSFISGGELNILAGEDWKVSDSFTPAAGLMWSMLGLSGVRQIAGWADSGFDTKGEASAPYVYMPSVFAGRGFPVLSNIWSDATATNIALIMRRAESDGSDGTYLLTKGNPYSEWTLIWVTTGETMPSPAYWVSTEYSSPNMSSFRIAQLGAPWDSDDGIATDSIASPSASDTFTHEADFICEFTVDTLPDPGPLHIWFRKQDVSNYWRLTITDSGYCRLWENVGGSFINRANGGSASTNSRVVIVADNETITCYVDDVEGHSYSSAVNFKTETSGEIETLGGGAISNLITWPRTLSGAVLTELQRYTT